MPNIPSRCQILVIGGGPGGSYAACALAREGFDVVLLEATRFPRYHIGESMLPSLRQFLKFIDCEDKIEKHGFAVKPGGAVKFNQFKKEGYTDFVSLDPTNGAWNVVRSEFDDILLNHAAENGVKVFQETKVTTISSAPNVQSFSLDPKTPKFRPVSAEYVKVSGERGSIAFDYLVDASGRNGIVSTKYLRNRHMNETLKNIACWTYWRGGGVYMPGTNRENAPYFEALTDETGWAWFIPLHNGTTSVGVVMNLADSIAKKRDASKKLEGTGQTHSLRDHYLSQLPMAPNITKFLGNAKMVEDGANTMKSASDFSYAAACYGGDHYRLVGDAGAFIDPFFSSGVHLALTGAFSAAASISSSIRGDVDERSAAQYHDRKVGVAYTRFLLVVMGVYRQIRALDSPILSDVSEDNFDRAFDIIRPVIQGAADVDKPLTQGELVRTMDFCKHLFAPTDPEMYTAVGARVNPELFSTEGPVVAPEAIDQVVDKNDDEARYVLKEVNARKAIHIMYKGTGNFEREEIAGWRVRCQPGSLGLVKA